MNILILTICAVLLMAIVVLLFMERRRFDRTVRFLCRQDADILEVIAKMTPLVQEEAPEGSEEEQKRRRLEKMVNDGFDSIMSYDMAAARKAVEGYGDNEQ